MTSEQWHNVESGRVFLLGTGPSLIAQLPLLEKLRGEKTFGCNGLPKWGALPFDPTYYALTDVHKASELRQFVFPERHMTRFNIGWADRENISEFNWIEKARDHVQVWSHGFVGFEDMLAPIPTGRTSPLTMCQLAAWLGFREFYFLGIEQSQYGYCFDPSATMSVRGMDLGTGRGQKYLLAVQRCFTKARETIEANGGKIYDCTPGGFLNDTCSFKRRGVPQKAILPYKSLEEVLK